MDGQQVAAGLAEIVDIAQRPVDHQMHIQRHIRDAADRRDDRDADRDIRHEQAVHHVHMDIIRAGFLQSADIALEIDKICR